MFREKLGTPKGAPLLQTYSKLLQKKIAKMLDTSIPKVYYT